VNLRKALAAPAVLTVTLAALLLPLAGTAAAGPGDLGTPVPRACPDFSTRVDAQAALEAHLVDADRIDPDHDGLACHHRMGEPAVAGERATGDGGGAAAFALVLGGLGAGVLGAGTFVQRAGLRRRPIG
jgi:hypothetical protein